jgi:hypothetical protein
LPCNFSFLRSNRLVFSKFPQNLVDDGNHTDGIPVKKLSHTCTQDTKYDSTTAQHYGYTRVLPVYVYYYFFIFFVFYT